MQNLSSALHVALKKSALCILVMLATLAIVTQSAYGAKVLEDLQKRVTISMDNATLEQVLEEINRQTGMNYGFQSNGVMDKNRRFSLEARDVTVEEALTRLLGNSPYTYVLRENRVVIVERQKEEVNVRKVSGRVLDAQNNPLPGVTVLLKGTTWGVITDNDGRYELSLPDGTALTIVFSFLGM